MRKDLGNNPLVYPQVVFIIATYDENGVPDAMNAAWGGIGDDHQIFICMDFAHKTAKNIIARKAFTVSMATADQLVPCDYVGIVSANNVPNKVDLSGFTTVKSQHVDAPIIEQLPLTIECTLNSYEVLHSHLFGDIVNVSADESILTDGKIDIEKLQPLLFNGVDRCYHAVGPKLAPAFTSGLAIKNK